jgi:hypothetical protein
MTKTLTITARVAEIDAAMAAQPPVEVMVFYRGAWCAYYNITLAT